MALRPVIIAASIGILATAAAAQPPAPPTGAERERMVAGIRRDYPTAPERVVQLMADARREIGDDNQCELVDFMEKARPAAADRWKVLTGFCRMPTDDLTPDRIKALLGDKDFHGEVSGQVATLVARNKDQPFICCSLQMPLTRLPGTDYWAGRFRLAQVDAAMISVTMLEPTARGPWPPGLEYRGPNAPKAPAVVNALQGKVVRTEFASRALRETRRLVIYTPPGWSKDKAWPALFLADGMAEDVAHSAEPLILSGRLKPLVLVSAESGDAGIVGPAPQGREDLRSDEYIRGWPGGSRRFEQHMDFFTQELPRYATETLGVSARREDRAVAGTSSGGVFALWAGVMHPEAFSASVAMSPGRATLTGADLKSGVRARFFMSGGLYEPDFILTAQAAERMLKSEGYLVEGRYLAAGHAPDQWDVILLDALLELFPGDAARVAMAE